MNILDGKGDLMGLVRTDLPERGMSWKIAKLAGPGESPYTHYDREIATRAQIWLREAAGGREAVIARGDLGFSPPPGYPADLG